MHICTTETERDSFKASDLGVGSLVAASSVPKGKRRRVVRRRGRIDEVYSGASTPFFIVGGYPFRPSEVRGLSAAN